MEKRAGADFHRLIFLLAAISLALVLLPATASATVFSGAAADPVGDGPEPGLDITRVSARYDNRIGQIDFEVQLAGTPNEQQITVGLGHRSASGGCSYPLLAIGGFLPDGSTIWVIDQDGDQPFEGQGQADRTVSGSKIELSARDRELEDFRPDCAEAFISDPTDPGVLFDTVGPFAVNPPPPKPALRARIAGIGPLKRRAARPVRVTVSNPGKAAARNVTLRMSVRGAATIRPRARKLGAIAPGRSKTVRFRVKVKPRAKGQVRLTARANGRAVNAVAQSAFRVRVPQPPPPPSRGGLSGQIFWGFESYRWDRSQDLVFLHFTNRRFVRWGIPGRGLVNCRRPTARVKDKKMQPGCLRYSYNRRNGQVRIGNVRGTLRGGKLKLNMKSDIWPSSGETWYRGVTAKRGARFNTRLINRGYHGACGISPFCTTWAENLQLTRDGRFGRQKSSLSTGGGIGTGMPFVAISRLGPDEKGRYTVLPGGRIRFAYANGKKQVETLIVQTNNRGRADPVREGLLVGDAWFYPDDD